MKEVVIYDTTLRDGEQMPGVVFTKSQKLELAKKSADFGSDIIDLMPAVSKTEREITEILAGTLKNKVLAATMMDKKHIDLAYSCGVGRVILFTPVSDIHLNNKLKVSRKKNLENSLRCLDYALEKGLKVSFAAEDATRADISYLIDFINAMEGKIDYFIPCDTLGVLTPWQTYKFIGKLKSETDCRLGLHIHNDFGQATANTLAGIEAGAELFSGTFTGIGERAGNAPIEEVIVSLRFQYGIKLPVKYKMLHEICSLVEKYSGVALQKHKPVSGENAFSHESGIHVDGILKYPPNYENFNPEMIGRKRRILFGKHSGTSGLKYFFGNRFNEKEYSHIIQQIKTLSEYEKRAFSEDEIKERFSILGR